MTDKYVITKDGAAAVDPDYFWRDIDENTPRGVKLQLLTRHGIAIYGQHMPGDTSVTHWAPLPKRRPQ
jgi:putative NIF3 family GTP cyclohydrolase 1 type 2